QDEGEREGGVGEDAERDVKSKGRAVSGRRGEFVTAGGNVGGEEEYEDEWHDEGADGALAMEEFEAEIGEREKPAEERHRAVEIVVGDGVGTAGAFEKREIVGDEADAEEDGAEAAGDGAAGAQIAKVGAEAEHVGQGRQI